MTNTDEILKEAQHSSRGQQTDFPAVTYLTKKELTL